MVIWQLDLSSHDAIYSPNSSRNCFRPSNLEMPHDMGVNMDILAKTMLLGQIYKQGVVIHSHTKVTRLPKDIAFA